MRKLPAYLLQPTDLPVDFGRFMLTRVLGDGAMARVFLAERQGTAGFTKEVALKVIRPRVGGDAFEFREMLLQEARLGAFLRHTNVVDVYELGEVEDQLYMAMELVEGLTLEQTLALDANPPLGVALDIAIQACQGLAFAHDLYIDGRAAGVVHRDLKPSNLLLSWSGTVKVADFGIAKVAERDLGLTQVGQIRGTPSYMSPEQVLGNALDKRSDVFSLAVILYRLFTGQKLFQEENTTSLLITIRDVDQYLADPVHLERAKKVLPRLDTVLARCLKENADERIADCHELGALLQGLRRTVPRRPTLYDWLVEIRSEHFKAPPKTDASLPTMAVDSTQTDQPPDEEPTESLDEGAPPKPKVTKRTSNIPALSDEFVGRERELAAISKALKKGARMVTITGLPGVGKTRLAHEFASQMHRDQEIDGGVWFCDLANALTLPGMLSVIGGVFNVPAAESEEDADRVEKIGRGLDGHGETLVLLDNFEQLVRVGIRTLRRWMEIAPNTTFIVTSQQALRLREEHVVSLEPLAPKAAVELFLKRARAISSREISSKVANTIVERLDRIPLAIELAAARVRLLSPTQILKRLDRRFELLTSTGKTALGHNSTLHSAIAWSWNLLEPWEQTTLAQCSVFVSGFSLEVAEHVVDLTTYPNAPWLLDIVDGLVDKSLIRVTSSEDENGNPRFDMYSSIQAFARAKLEESGDTAAAKDRLALRLLETAQKNVDRLPTRDGAQAIRALVNETDNLMASMQHVRKSAPDVCGRLALALTHMLGRVGPDTKLVEIATEALKYVTADHPTIDAELRIQRGMAQIRLGNDAAADEDAQNSLRIVKRLHDPLLQGQALHLQARIAFFNCDWSGCLRLQENAVNLFKRAGSRRWLAVALYNVAYALEPEGRLEEKDRVMEAALEVARSVGDRVSEARCVGGLAFSAERHGQWDRANEMRRESLALYNEQKDVEGVFFQTIHLGTLALAFERFEEAQERYDNALELAKRAGKARGVTLALSAQGLLALNTGDFDLARQHIHRAEERFQTVTPHPHLQGFLYAAWATLAAETAQFERADVLLKDAKKRLARGAQSVVLIEINQAQIDICRAREARTDGDLETATALRQKSARALKVNCDGKDALAAQRRLKRTISVYDTTS